MSAEDRQHVLRDWSSITASLSSGYGSFRVPHVIATPNHRYTIIILHGRGSSAREFAQGLFYLTTSEGKSLREALAATGCRWVFPGAHVRMSTVFREELREWFDISSLNDPEEQSDLQVDGLQESIRYIHNVIHDELALVPPSRIFLGGISQGFATAIHALLSGSHRLGGFIGLSGWIPFMSQLREQNDLAEFYATRLNLRETAAPGEVLGTPVYMSHSADDGTVAIRHGIGAAEALRGLGMDVQFEAFGHGGHWVQQPEGFDGIEKFVRARLAAVTSC